MSCNNFIVLFTDCYPRHMWRFVQSLWRHDTGLVSLQRCSEIAIAISLFSLQLICHVICDVAWKRSIANPQTGTSILNKLQWYLNKTESCKISSQSFVFFWIKWTDRNCSKALREDNDTQKFIPKIGKTLLWKSYKASIGKTSLRKK